MPKEGQKKRNVRNKNPRDSEKKNWNPKSKETYPTTQAQNNRMVGRERQNGWVWGGGFYYTIPREDLAWFKNRGENQEGGGTAKT